MIKAELLMISIDGAQQKTARLLEKYRQVYECVPVPIEEPSSSECRDPPEADKSTLCFDTSYVEYSRCFGSIRIAISNKLITS